MTTSESQFKDLEKQLHTLYDNQTKHVQNVERALDKHQACFVRHCQELDNANEKITKLKGLVASMSNKLCNCSRNPMLSGKGTMNDPWCLEYEGDEYCTPPSTSSNPLGPSLITSPPQENSDPVPVPTPATETPLCHSNKENIPPCVAQ